MSRKIIGLDLLIIGLLCFIWGNSLMTGADSGSVSGGILAWLGQFFPGLMTEEGHHFLRKAAHFSEFFLLGALCALRRGVLGKQWSVSLNGFGLMTACIDETIQIYVPGRGSSLLDVWLDAAGFTAGAAVIAAGYAIVKKRKEK